MGTVVDVGGGHGGFITAILQAHRGVRGILTELDRALAGARTHLAANALADRCDVLACDFFTDPLPPGAGCYLLAHIIHNWNDQQAVAILRAVRAAVPGNGRLLLVEAIIPDDDTPHLGFTMGGIAVVILIAALFARPGVLSACLAGVLVLQTCLVQSLAGQPGRQHCPVRRPARPGRAARAGHRRLPVHVGQARAGMNAIVRPATATRRTGAAGNVPAGRRAARISAGAGAAVALAGMAGAALTFAVGDGFKGNDLVFNLAALAAAAAYATLGALVGRRAGSLIGWLMLAEGAGLAFITLASTYCLLGITTFPGDLSAARQAGTLAESGFAPVAFLIVLTFLLFPTRKLPSRRWRPVVAAGIAATTLSTSAWSWDRAWCRFPFPAGSRPPSPTRSARRGSCH
jgi:hypothetical protein